MKRCSVVVLASLTLLAMCFAAFGSALAQDKENKVNAQEAPKGAKDSAKTKAIQKLELASRLIQFGRANKNAEALLLAAQILHTTPTEPLKVGKETEKGDESAMAAKQKDNSPKALIAEAKKISGAAHVEGMAAATQKIVDEETRGAAAGPQRDIFTILPGQTINWNPITFVGGQKAIVDVDLGGAVGRMALEVRDQFGNLVARDGVTGPYYNVQWYPAFTGAYRVRLINFDSISFKCSLLTN
jgi:hypothetical protein